MEGEVVGASPGRGHVDGSDLSFGEVEVKEAAVGGGDIGDPVHNCVVFEQLNLKGLDVIGDDLSAGAGELDRVTSGPAEPIKHCVMSTESLGHMLGHCLRGDAEPGLRVEPDTFIVLLKQVEPLVPVLPRIWITLPFLVALLQLGLLAHLDGDLPHPA